MMSRVVAGTIFVAVLCAALGTTVPDIVDQSLVRPGQQAPQPAPIPTRGDPQNGVLVREVQLYSADRAALARADELRLTIGTYDTAPSLQSSTLALGPTCAFRGAAATLGGNRPLRLIRAADCTAVGAGPVTLTLVFNAASPLDARAALWTVSADDTSPLLLSADAESRTSAVMARLIGFRSAARTPRAELLAFMWDLPPAAVWAAALAGALLFAAGSAFALRTGTLAAGAATFALAAGLGLCYAVTVPPLQAPDEPDHLLSFAALAQRPDLAAATSSWARRIHFYRMTFMGDERFTPGNRDEPFDRDWPPQEIFAENVARRSSTTTRLWQVLMPVVPAQPARALLLFRVVDAVIFASGMAAGAALLAGSRRETRAGSVALVLLLLPTLPFFGMHLSEISFTLAAFLLTGYAALMLTRDEPPRHAGLVLGLAVAFIAAGPRNGWPAVLIIAGLCAGRILCRSIASETATDAGWFWGGLALPGVVLFGTGVLWVPSPFYEQWHLVGFDPRAGVSAIQFMLPLAGGALAGITLERIAAAVAPLRPAAAAARLGCAVAAAGVCLSLLWSSVAPLPHLQTVESGQMPSAGSYVWSVIRTLATAARGRDFDFLTWTSLWGGFGWINPVLPASAIAGVTMLVSICAAATLIRVARDPGGRAALMTLAVLAGIAAGVAAAALSSYGLNRNIHGRYLLGGCVVGLCVLVAPLVIGAGRGMSDRVRSAALHAAVCAVHGYALTFLLQAYFG